MKLCAKAPQFLLAYQHSAAYRTSNMVDRHMDVMDCYLASCKILPRPSAGGYRQ